MTSPIDAAASPQRVQHSEQPESSKSIQRSTSPRPSADGAQSARVQPAKAAKQPRSEISSNRPPTEDTPLLGPAGSERRQGVFQGAVRLVRRAAGASIQQTQDPERGTNEARQIAPTARQQADGVAAAEKPDANKPPARAPLSEHSSFNDFEHYILRIGSEDIGYATSMLYRSPKYLKQTLEVVRDGVGIIGGVGSSMGIASVINAPAGYLFDSTLGKRIGGHISTTVDTIFTGERPIGQEFKSKWEHLKKVLAPKLQKLEGNAVSGAERLSNMIDFCATEFTKLTRKEEVTTAHLDQPKVLMLRLAFMACAATLKLKPVVLGQDDPEAYAELKERLSKMDPDLAEQIRDLLTSLQNSGARQDVQPQHESSVSHERSEPLSPLMWPDGEGGLKPFEWPEDSAADINSVAAAMLEAVAHLNAFIMRGPGGSGKTSILDLIGRSTGLPVMPINLAATTVRQLRGPQQTILTAKTDMSLQEVAGIFAEQIVRSNWRNCILFLDESDLSSTDSDIVDYLKQVLQDHGAILDMRGLSTMLDARDAIWAAASNKAVGDAALAQRLKEFFFRGLTLEEKDTVAWSVLTNQIKTIASRSGRRIATKIGTAIAPMVPEIVEMDAQRNYGGRVIKDVLTTITAALEESLKQDPSFVIDQDVIVKKMESAYLSHRSEADIYFKVTRNERSDALNLLDRLIKDADKQGANIDVRSLKDVRRFINVSRVGRNDHALILISQALADGRFASTLEQSSAIFIAKGLAEVCKRASVDAIHVTLPIHKALRHLMDALYNKSVTEPAVQVQLLDAMRGMLGALPDDNSRKVKTLDALQDWLSDHGQVDPSVSEQAAAIGKGDKGKAPARGD